MDHILGILLIIASIFIERYAYALRFAIVRCWYWTSFNRKRKLIFVPLTVLTDGFTALLLLHGIAVLFKGWYLPGPWTTVFFSLIGILLSVASLMLRVHYRKYALKQMGLWECRHVSPSDLVPKNQAKA